MPSAVCGNKGLPVVQSMIQVLLLYTHASARPLLLQGLQLAGEWHPSDSVGPAAVIHPRGGVDQKMCTRNKVGKDPNAWACCQK
jgi:hypothetical protein